MIEQVRIENLGVIAAAQLDLAPTFTVITGETGAGKTMVLTSLDLLLGGRADPALVRRGADLAFVEGAFSVPAGSAVASRAAEAGAAVEDGELLALRTVPANGRSRAHLGGRTVPTAVLAEIGEQMVTVHGQSQQLRLRAPAQQRAALDAFGGPEHAALLAAYRAAHAAFVTVRAELAAWERESDARDHEIALLRAGLDQVDALEPLPGEDHALKEEAQRLGNVESLRAAAGHAHQALTGGADGPDTLDATTLVDSARRSLDQAADDDPALAEWSRRLADVSYLLADVATEIAGYLADLDADPARLAAVHARRAALTELTRVHGPDVDAALAWAERARERLDYLDGPEDTGQALRERLDRATTALTAAAAALTASRGDVADRLAAAVDAELAGLAMRGAHLSARLTPLPEPGPHGAEDVELLLAAHPGAPARPLGQGASGGELSRVMLAIEVALATDGWSADGAASGGAASDGQTGSGPRTFVFDEVDAGVGGKAAVEVGRRLARLARGAQVIVVTHLAQVAAFADRHLVVRKDATDDDGAVTATDVTAVEGAERVRELARMLSGQEDSGTALRHAAELLELSSVRP